MKLDSSIAAPILIGSVLAASSPPELSSPDSLVSAASVDSLLELDPPPHATKATLIAKTKSIIPNFKNGDLKIPSSYTPMRPNGGTPLPTMSGKLPQV
jgi:hypothetical protein